MHTIETPLTGGASFERIVAYCSDVADKAGVDQLAANASLGEIACDLRLVSGTAGYIEGGEGNNGWAVAFGFIGGRIMSLTVEASVKHNTLCTVNQHTDEAALWDYLAQCADLTPAGVHPAPLVADTLSNDAFAAAVAAQLRGEPHAGRDCHSADRAAQLTREGYAREFLEAWEKSA